MPEPVLTEAQRAFFNTERRAILATTSPEGRPRLVPVCFWLSPQVDSRGRAILYTPIDQKPKESTDPHNLARVRDILVLPEVTLLVEHWDEDWSRLAWLRASGVGEMLGETLGESWGRLDDGVRRSIVGRMTAQARALHAITENMLVDRILDLDALTVELQPIAPAALLIDMAESLRLLCGAHDLELQIAPELSIVLVDQIRLLQVLVNLVMNATRHAPPGTPIELRAREDWPWVAIEVCDRGPGIHYADRVRVLEKNVRLTRRSARARPRALHRVVAHARDGRIARRRRRRRRRLPGRVPASRSSRSKTERADGGCDQDRHRDPEAQTAVAQPHGRARRPVLHPRERCRACAVDGIDREAAVPHEVDPDGDEQRAGRAIDVADRAAQRSHE